MLGIVTGDIIASPYVRNPLPDAFSIFFPLFASSERVEIDEARRRARSVTVEAKPGVMSSLAMASTKWMLGGDLSREAWSGVLDEGGLSGRGVSSVQMLSVCGPVVELSGTLEDAKRNVSVVFGSVKVQGDAAALAEAFTELLWGVKMGRSAEELRNILSGYGYDVSRNASEMRLFLDGSVTLDGNGKLVPGSGKAVRDAAQVLPAALAAFTESGSLEETVRRAAAMGGDASLTAALAGALAEQKWSVPDQIGKRTLDFFGDSERNLEKRLHLAKNHMSENKENTIKAEREAINGTCFSVIRMEGYHPVYVVPEGNVKLRNAVSKLIGNTGNGGEIISPSAFDKCLADLSSQKDIRGRELAGTYVEHPRPDVHHLWFQDGKIVSSTTRMGVDAAGNAISSVSARENVMADFQAFKSQVEEIRDRLEESVGFKSVNGMHVHFANAFYPVVLDRAVELYQGDILRGRAEITDNGRFRVNTNVATGSNIGEYLEGAMNATELFHKGMDMKDVLSVIDQYCMDYGRILDESERAVMKEGDESEIESLKRKYRSNYELAVADMVGDLPEAVKPVSLSYEEGRMAREERRLESVERYEGLSRSDAADSQKHKGSIFTVGHSNFSADEFNTLMRRHGIDVVVDVRAVPGSSFNKQFNRNTFEKNLDGVGIEYHHTPELSIRQSATEKGPDGKETTRQLSYDEILSSSTFKEKMRSLYKGVRQGLRIALVSAEADPYSSPRFTLLGRAFAHPELYDKRCKPIDVQHITRKGYCLGQDFFENRLERDYRSVNKASSLDVAYSMRISELANPEREKGISLNMNMKRRENAPKI